jgi:hypothetical protein
VSKSVANPLSDKDSRPAASAAFFMGNRHYPWTTAACSSDESARDASVMALAIAAATDYIIFLVGRYQEARTAGESREDAYDGLVERGQQHAEQNSDENEIAPL